MPCVQIEFEGAVYRVRSMNLNSTVLRRLDGQEMYVSNTILMLKPVFNLRRSPHQTETLTLNASIFTPREKLQEVGRRCV